MNPCHLHHLLGSCRKLECTHLHDQIRFTPEALQQYRIYLNAQMCPYGSTCNYNAAGKCFYGHTCLAGSNCLRPGCPYDHTARLVPSRQPVGLSQGLLHVPIDRLQIGSEKKTSFALSSGSLLDKCRSLQYLSRIVAHQPTTLASNFPKPGTRSQARFPSCFQLSMSTCRLPLQHRACRS